MDPFLLYELGISEIEPFNGSSFDLWQFSMSEILDLEDLHHVLDGPDCRRAGLSMKKWKQLYRKARELIQEQVLGPFAFSVARTENCCSGPVQVLLPFCSLIWHFVHIWTRVGVC